MRLEENQKNFINDAIIQEIVSALGSLKYGQVQITVHNSRIVQIDKIEKKRFDDIGSVEKGGGI